jgi:hypothetical protein
MIILKLNNKILEFFRLNLIALRINNYYKLNLYLILFLFICIISSIIIRINVINENILFNNDILFIMFNLLLILTFFYSLKLIFDIIYKCVQAIKIIPEFIKLYKFNVINIKSVIILYYLQNIFFILFSCWILFVIFSKLNIFIDNISIYILAFGIISSIIFIYKYPIKQFNFENNINNYPL